MKAKYYIDGAGGNDRYENLYDVRHHVSFEPKTYNGLCVCRESDVDFCRVIKVLKSGKVILSKT